MSTWCTADLLVNGVEAQPESAGEEKSRKVDLTWLDSIDPEVEAHLLPTERAILGALREYRKECLQVE
jgi:hypothetical protein